MLHNHIDRRIIELKQHFGETQDEEIGTMGDRFHVWFFTFCYSLLGLIGGLNGGVFLLAYLYVVLTPGILWYAWHAYRAGRS